MIISTRDDVVVRKNRLIKILFSWAVSSTVILFVMTLLCGYAFLSRPIKIVPFNGNSFSVSDRDYSPAYLSEMARKVAQLRYTFNPETVSSQYASLYNSADIKFISSLKDSFSKEIITIKHKEISSVLYIAESRAFPEGHYAIVKGKLERSSHGIHLSSNNKKLKVKFNFNGTLNLNSIEDVSDE